MQKINIDRYLSQDGQKWLNRHSAGEFKNKREAVELMRQFSGWNERFDEWVEMVQIEWAEPPEIYVPSKRAIKL